MTTTPTSLVSEINAIYTPLLSGLSFDLNIPLELANIDLVTAPPVFTTTVVANYPALTLESLTVGEETLTGDGAFDVIMRAVNAHLDSQYKKNRLSGAEWGKVYIQGIDLALSQAANYLVASINAAWAGESAKRQAELLEIQKATLIQEHSTRILETITAKMGLAKMQIDAYVAQGGLVSIKTKIGDMFHDILMKEAQQVLIDEQVDQARSMTKDTLTSGATVAGSVAIDKNLKTKQLVLVDEQIDAARAQTKDTITGGVTGVVGILGSQKLLYDQQRQSYIHDSMNKAAKVLSDAWTTQKTVDDGWTPPSAFLNTYIDPALKEYIGSVGLATNPGGP